MSLELSVEYLFLDVYTRWDGSRTVGSGVVRELMPSEDEVSSGLDDARAPGSQDHPMEEQINGNLGSSNVGVPPAAASRE